MNKKLAYKILEDINLVIEYHRGEIYIDDIINMKKEIFLDKQYHNDINLLMDIRYADYKISEQEINKYVQFAHNNLNSIGERKTSLLTSRPNEVAVGIQYEILKGDLPMKTNVFSTLEASLIWLNCNKEFDRVNNTLMELSKDKL